ncbi:hypothetical protein K449DRAFT_354592 [Hypoxylon sp. EC38]|nr:hypothetical protein K449DRAFT_354592 [Hypoxylon sp. EC38]OTA97256.1 hypothetical protein M434DRAFT_391969 [Hypoxylon sp. CO27-5]
MKFLATAALFAAVAAADTVFSVSEFSAGCIPHSTQCLYSFKVIQPGTMETTGVECTAMVPSNGGLLPDVKEGTCKESSRTFTVVRGDAGLTLTVTQPVTPSSNQSGSHLLPKDQLVISDKPNAYVESYNGPAAFDLTS